MPPARGSSAGWLIEACCRKSGGGIGEACGRAGHSMPRCGGGRYLLLVRRLLRPPLRGCRHVRHPFGLQGHLQLQLKSGRLVEVDLPVVVAVAASPGLVRGGRRRSVDPRLLPRHPLLLSLLNLSHPLVSLLSSSLSFRSEVVVVAQSTQKDSA